MKEERDEGEERNQKKEKKLGLGAEMGRDARPKHGKWSDN